MAVRDLAMTVCPGAIECGGTACLELSLEADPGLGACPADMVLVLDRSGSMCGDRLKKLKGAAKHLIALLAQASGDESGRTILGGSRLAVLGFSREAQVMAPMETRVEVLQGAVDALEAQGDTNHERAFRAAGKLLEGSRAQRQILILFTDGISNLGNPDPAAAALRHGGVEIYCIGLLSNACLLRDWASCPREEHMAVTADPNDLQQLFGDIAGQVAGSCPGLGTVEVQLSRDFRILKAGRPSQGFVEAGAENLRWDLGSMGERGRAVLTLEILHLGKKEGCLGLAQQAVYRDREGCCLSFPQAFLEVESCGCSPVIPEPCPECCFVTLERCQDLACCECPDLGLDGLGRIVEVSGVIRNVCPGKRIALAVMLTEKDPEGREYPRGTKTLLIPAQQGEGCRDLQIRCIRFAVPEALAPWNCQQDICSERFFQVRMFAHYVDTDYICCDGEAFLS